MSSSAFWTADSLGSLSPSKLRWTFFLVANEPAKETVNPATITVAITCPQLYLNHRFRTRSSARTARPITTGSQNPCTNWRAREAFFGSFSCHDTKTSALSRTARVTASTGERSGSEFTGSALLLLHRRRRRCAADRGLLHLL